MIHFRSGEKWSPDWETPADGKVFIDLRDQHTEQDIIKTIGTALKGKESRSIQGNSLDAMNDVVSDWFIDNWGTKKTIYIAGASNIEKVGGLFFLNLVSCMYSAFLGAVYDRSINHNSEGIEEEIGNPHIYFVMN